MEFNYKYGGITSVVSNATSVGMSFAPDTLREPTFFVGKLNKKIAFREAISALHDVVVSDMRFKPKDKTAYKEWAAQQEKVWLSEFVADLQVQSVKDRLEVVRQELQQIYKEKSRILDPYYKSVRSYYDYLYQKDRDTWFVLDPVITVHPDEVFFECFSQDESTYGKLEANYNVFNEINEFECGTTNIDYSSDLYNEFQKIREYKDTDFKIDPSGFTVKTTNEEEYKEVKIDLPDSWVRGFLQVSSAMTLPTISFELHPMDVYNICLLLRRFKEKVGPRSIKFILKPNEPVTLLFEPFNKEIICARSIYNGNEAQTIRIWGRRRLLILERLIPIAQKFTVHLVGSGLPSFYVADLGDMTYTLGLSGWSANDWSRVGNFDLMAPRAEIDGFTAQNIYNELRKNWFEKPESLAKRLNTDTKTVFGALGTFTQAGKTIYDLNQGVYRIRELSREALPIHKLRFDNPREEQATNLVKDKKVFINTEKTAQGLSITGNVRTAKRTFTTSVLIDNDERIVQAKCDCDFYIQNKLYKGPCEHIIALRIEQREKAAGR
ncbi:SWIM zinc finger family protein [Emticicia sp. C21]|uniref:SWIM zinc finger family protein n=1 Tax=Emticicia sp. C21 TaxID=2302915 RepID=UPI000E340676|nr:SWIM zinc finger family protein [Emticicia sp. C21]RFS13771.1 SWIM zinc finger family protein [Emticicia sp. C21]